MKAGSFGPKPQKNTLPRDPAGCRGGCLELAGTKDLDLREGGEGGRVISLDELIELQAGDDHAVQVEQLALGGLGERQDALFAGGKGQAGLCPPCVVGEIGAGGQDQRFGADRTLSVIWAFCSRSWSSVVLSRRNVSSKSSKSVGLNRYSATWFLMDMFRYSKSL